MNSLVDAGKMEKIKNVNAGIKKRVKAEVENQKAHSKKQLMQSEEHSTIRYHESEAAFVSTTKDVTGVGQSMITALPTLGSKIKMRHSVEATESSIS